MDAGAHLISIVVSAPLLQYVLPTNSPLLSKSALKMALSPMLWTQHKPDRFDVWSAGGAQCHLLGNAPASTGKRVFYTLTIARSQNQNLA